MEITSIMATSDQAQKIIDKLFEESIIQNENILIKILEYYSYKNSKQIAKIVSEKQEEVEQILIKKFSEFFI